MNKPRLTGMDILSHLGMIGSTLSTNSLVPRAETPMSLARQQQEFMDAGNIADPDVWSRYAQVMKRPATMETMLQLWDEMSTWDLIQAALVQIVDEVCQTDGNSPNAITFECNNKKVEDDLNRLRDKLDVDTLITSQVWHVTALGNHFEKIDYEAGEGVKGLTFVHPFEIRRYWLERNRQCIGFKWKGHPPNKDDVFVMPDNKTPVERVALSHGKQIEDLHYPWDFLHLRRMFRLRGSEHGEPLFDEAQGLYKKLRLALDQMVVHRAQVQPDRYVVNIDTQDLPPTEQLKTIQRWKQSMRNKLAFGIGADQQTFSDPTEFRSFYNPWALDTIFYMARPKGVEHAITKLNGTPQVPDVFDIELLIDLFFSIIGMPKSWFGIGAQDSSNPPSGKSLLAQDIRFLRKVKSIRKPIVAGYTWLAYFHCLLKNYDIGSLNIQAKMPDIGGLEDQMKIDLIKSQADVLAALGQVMQTFNLPKEAWIELIFKKYLHLPDDVIDVFITSLPPEQEQTQAPMESRIPAPGEKVLIEHIDRVLRNEIELVYKVKKYSRQLKEDIDSTRYSRDQKLIAYMPESKGNDIVRISWDTDAAFVVNKGAQGTQGAPKSTLTESLNGQPVTTNAFAEAKTPDQGNTGEFQPQWRRFIKAGRK